ncbi:YkuS family protein [Bacillus sp. B190/17]|uniref:YkuS family protein n=1 Tax=Bacillus lumedeiriae TaxID=3058829 RepID=A0ABW8IB77_9BACI
MTKKVAVEQSLTNVTEALRGKGYEVVDLQSAADIQNTQNCSVYVVSGMDSNMMGIHDTSTKAPIIEATGMSADEICREVEERMH